MNRTLVLAIAAVAAIAVGVATSFFELIVLGVVAAVAAVVLGVRDRVTGGAPSR
ncbi:MAG TPA: hypothetical protein VH418_13535 [Solirubrobacteraceae bacterium]|jgi:hypothetical protein